MKSREDLKGLTLEELNDKLNESLQEYDNLHIQQATHQLTNPIRLRDVRKEIARLKTFIHQYELGIGVGKTENA